MDQTSQVDLTVIIKTLNEEKNIARCIESVLGSIDGITLELIVADSGSNDRTVEIAMGYPITVVQLEDPTERSCGIGPQLGYQHSHGQYILILDADMVLHAPFVRAALGRMERDPRCGGIGGQLVERSGTGYEYELQSILNAMPEKKPKWLNGCAIYRRAAIESVGYFSNRNLHAYEEKELGMRLTHAGWNLCKLSDIAVDHYGHTASTTTLLWRRWQSGYADACGESIRACIGKPYLMDMLRVHRAAIACFLWQLFFVIGVLATPWVIAPLALSLLVLILAGVSQLARKGSVVRALHSLLHLNVFAVGIARGLIKPQVSPALPIRSVTLTTAD